MNKLTEIDICPHCQSHRYEPEQIDWDNGVEVVGHMKYFRCLDCGWSFDHPESQIVAISEDNGDGDYFMATWAMEGEP